MPVPTSTAAPGRVPIRIWTQMPIFHLTPLFRALDARDDVALVVHYLRPVTAARRALGWSDDLAGHRSDFLPAGSGWRAALRTAWRERRCVHFFHGMWNEPQFALALLVLAAVGGRYAIFTEAQDPRPRRSLAKRAAQRLLGAVVLRRAAVLLPISTISERFYRSLGTPLPPILPFCYFHADVPVDDVGAARRRADAAANPDRSCRLVFVGRIDADKGLEQLIDVLARPDVPATVTLTVVGDGDRRAAAEALVAAHGLGARVTFVGRVESTAVAGWIERSDLLVLPSRWDGWGMVVNEAMAAGVPALVTEACGARDLVVHGRNGYVVPIDDADALAAAVRAHALRRDDWRALSRAARATAALVAAPRGADYVTSIARFALGEPSATPVVPLADMTRVVERAASRAGSPPLTVDS